MLKGKGFKTVYNVAGGIKAWKAKKATGTSQLGMALFQGSESSEDILKVAYSLEQGLRDFYFSMADQSEYPKVKDLFVKLSEIEVKHQELIFLAYCNIAVADMDRAAFEKTVEKDALEGGMTTREYLDLFQPDLSSPIEVVSLAMSIEAQALDLYQRVSQSLKNTNSKKIVQQIANEEKAHLESLGKLMERI